MPPPVDLPYPEFLIGVSATATPTTVTVKAEANCEGLSMARRALMSYSSSRFRMATYSSPTSRSIWIGCAICINRRSA
jgi:hypothetical protein